MSSKLRFTLWIALCAAFLGVGLSRLRFDTRITSLFPSSIKEARGLQLFLEHFSHPGELLVVLEGGDEKELLDAAKALEEALPKHPELVRRVVARGPWETRPEQMVDFFAFSLLNLPPDRLQALAARLSAEQIEATLAKSMKDLEESLTMEESLGGYDPLGLGALVMSERSRGFGSFDSFTTPDKGMRLLVVESVEPGAGYKAKLAWLNRLREVCNAELAKLGGKTKAWFTGEPAFVAEIANGMESDMRGSGISTLILSLVLFWLVYRRFLPLVGLNFAMLAIILATMAACGLFVGQLTVFTAGFASILVGLAIDYGVITFEESQNRGLSGAALRQHVRPSIWAAAGTTSVAFFSLLASSLPGLKELGLLLGLGIAIAAVVMVEAFSRSLKSASARPLSVAFTSPVARRFFTTVMPLVTVFVLLGAAVGIAVRGTPRLDTSPRPLRPRNCEAQETMDRLLQAMSGSETAMSLLVSGKNEEEVGRELGALAKILDEGRAAGTVQKYALPVTIWPEPNKQKANLATGMTLANDAARLRAAVDQAGFSVDEAFSMAQGVFDCWRRWSEKAVFPIWPESEASQWTVSRYLHKTPEAVYCMGILQTSKNAGGDALIKSLMVRPQSYVLGDGVLLSALGARLPTETLRILSVLAAGTLGMLILTFRRAREIIACLAVVMFNLTALLGVMAWVGWNWNLINLAALLLCLGTGVDYSIHVLLSLRRHAGDVAKMQGTTGRALMVCAMSSIIGFGSLSWAGNMGLASLGMICATALFLNLLMALFILPLFFRAKHAPPP